jgi:tRNA dimethylallyltransferase
VPPPLVVIVGPTASGKSRLAIELARAAGGEVISADSQQVYLGMDIGTGKVSPAERAAVPHHLIDVVRPDDPMTAARFLELADAAIADVSARGRSVIVAGGTGLYVRVLLFGLSAAPGGDPEIRRALAEEAARSGIESLWRRLDEVDPETAARVDRNDQKRIVRALEVYEISGIRLSEHQRRHDFEKVPPRYPAQLVGLGPPRAELTSRIDARVDEMMDSGLLEEVGRLRSAGHGPELRSQQAIGYAELHEHLDGHRVLGEAVERIKRNSRRYARRQTSWYRGDARVAWHERADEVDLGELRRYLAGP